MGNLRFTIPSEGFDPRIWESAYITGIEGIPWRCHHSREGDQFSIGREIDESGKLNIIWPTNSLGNVCLTTTSLRVREKPYNLIAEIARGTVYKLKSQTFEWQRIGLKLPDEFFPLAESSLDALLHALVSDDAEQIDTCSQRAIDDAIEATELLCRAFSSQALDARRSNEGRLSTLMGVQLEPDSSFDGVHSLITSAFNLIAVSCNFAATASTSSQNDFNKFDLQIQHAAESEMKICVGPLIDLRPGKMPPWMLLLDEKFDSVLESSVEHVRKCVERYRGRVHLWNCASGLNVPNSMGWSDEEILRMAVSLIETVRRCDDRSPVLLTIDQPWSEYLRNDASGISPLHFADALIRADLGLSGLALELNFDCWPGGSFPRDPIEISRLIDRWSMLGLPLMVIISSPTVSSDDDTYRVSNWATRECSAKNGSDDVIRLLASKPSVHAIIWNSLTMPASGTHQSCQTPLWTSTGKAHQLHGKLAKIKSSYLQ